MLRRIHLLDTWNNTRSYVQDNSCIRHVVNKSLLGINCIEGSVQKDKRRKNPLTRKNMKYTKSHPRPPTPTPKNKIYILWVHIIYINHI